MGERNPRFCFQCDNGTVLVHDTLDVVIDKGNLSEKVQAVEGLHCPVCGEIEFEDDGAIRYTQALDALNQRLLKKP